MKTVLIGRHQAEAMVDPHFGEIEIAEQINFQFPATGRACARALMELLDRVIELEAAALLFQALPGQVMAGLMQLEEWRQCYREIEYSGHYSTPADRSPESIEYAQRLESVAPIKIGVVISVPGERPERQEKEFNLLRVPAGYGVIGNYSLCLDVEAAKAAFKLANPRAKVEFPDDQGIVRISVEPPMPFIFSHIEWLHW